MLTIQLLNLSFFAYHGIHEEEKKWGGEFEVTVTISHQPTKNPVVHINETIDYVSVYKLLKQHMENPRSLLETVVTTFANDVFAHFSQAEELSITIIKKHPPIAAFEGSVAVSYTAKREV